MGVECRSSCDSVGVGNSRMIREQSRAFIIDRGCECLWISESDSGAGKDNRSSEYLRTSEIDSDNRSAGRSDN